MGYLKTCDICKTGVGPPRSYALRRYVPLQPGERSQNSRNVSQGRFESAGSIDLCDNCWRRTGGLRMRPQRKPKRVHNQHGEFIREGEIWRKVGDP